MGKRGPYNMEYDHRFIKPVRMLRNKTLKDFSEYMDTDPATICKLETGVIQFTPLYEARFREACKRLRVSNIELQSVRTMLEIKARKGYK